MKKKRIAIQLYGNLRTYKKTYKYLRRNIIDSNSKFFEFDIFIHSWNKIDNADKVPHYVKIILTKIIYIFHSLITSQTSTIELEEEIIL